MTQHQSVRIARHRLISFAITGSLACLALLAAWLFASRGGAVRGREPASLLLEFLLYFIVSFGALVLARVLLSGRRAQRAGKDH
jgi:hypothetical protein